MVMSTIQHLDTSSIQIPTTVETGDLKFGLVQISNGQKEVGLKKVQILNGI